MPKTRVLWRVTLIAAGLLGMPAGAQPVDALQAADAAVQSVGWKLARANAPWCARRGPAIGLLLLDSRTYTDPAAARSTYGLTGDIAVDAVAQGGPADRAGVRANATVEQLGGRTIDELAGTRRGWDRLDALDSAIDAALTRDGAIDVRLTGRPALRITGETACSVRFLLDDGKGGARASRARVRIGRRLFEETRGDEGLLAAVVAHELAHAVLDHESQISDPHRAPGTIRRTEREADRLSVWLLANAGYDPALSVRFMEQIGRAHDFLIADPGHGSWKARAREMTVEIAALHAAQAADPNHAANWPRDFRRES
jgi:ribosomal protein L16/L10AE